MGRESRITASCSDAFAGNGRSNTPYGRRFGAGLPWRERPWRKRTFRVEFTNGAGQSATKGVNLQGNYTPANRFAAEQRRSNRQRRMRRTPPEANIESVPRDAPLKADSIPDRLSTHARLSQGLQRLYSPPEGQPERLGQLVELLHSSG